MLRGMSTHVYTKDRLHPGMLDGFARGGAQVIEIFAARGHFDYTDRAHIREIAGWFQSSSVVLRSLHSPMHSDAEWGRSGGPGVNLVDPEKRNRIDSMDEIKRAIEVAEHLPFKFLVQHIGTGRDTFGPDKFEFAITAVEHLRAFAKPLNVTLLLENIRNELSTPEHLLELIRAGRFEDVGICFDIGHANLMGGVAADFELLRDHIQATHIHDNQGDRDAHLWPGAGTIDWPQALELLHSAPHLPPLMLEIGREAPTDVVGGMSTAFEMMEKPTAAAH